MTGLAKGSGLRLPHGRSDSTLSGVEEAEALNLTSELRRDFGSLMIVACRVVSTTSLRVLKQEYQVPLNGCRRQ